MWCLLRVVEGAALSVVCLIHVVEVAVVEQVVVATDHAVERRERRVERAELLLGEAHPPRAQRVERTVLRRPSV